MLYCTAEVFKQRHHPSCMTLPVRLRPTKCSPVCTCSGMYPRTERHIRVEQALVYKYATDLHLWQGGIPSCPDTYRGRSHQPCRVQWSVHGKRPPSRFRQLRHLPHYEACRDRRAGPEGLMVPEVERALVCPSGGESSRRRQQTVALLYRLYSGVW